MKILLEIINAVKNNEKLEYDELRYAFLAVLKLNTINLTSAIRFADSRSRKKNKGSLWPKGAI